MLPVNIVTPLDGGGVADWLDAEGCRAGREEGRDETELPQKVMNCELLLSSL